jgi:hypothetical protein
LSAVIAARALLAIHQSHPAATSPARTSFCAREARPAFDFSSTKTAFPRKTAIVSGSPLLTPFMRASMPLTRERG